MFDTSAEQYQLLIYLINLVGCFFLGFLLYYHVRNMLLGRGTHEKTKLYELTRIENIRNVLGERWYLTWISPFLISKLPHDGVNWQMATKAN